MRPFCGEVNAHVRVIEFQKRELPHAHCIFLPALQSKVSLPQLNSIKALISARIPSSDNSSLQQVILKHNIHSPCGKLNPSDICRNDGACTKQFSKEFVDETGYNYLQSYITYRWCATNKGKTASRIYCIVYGSS